MRRRRRKRPGPDNPPWGIPAAALLFAASYYGEHAIRYVTVHLIRLIGFTPSERFSFVYALLELPLSDLLVLALAWAIVTGFGRRPFLATLGWSWPARLRVREVTGKRFSARSVTIFLGLLVASVGSFLAGFFTRADTRLDQEFRISPWVPIVYLSSAVLLAPLIEEIVYRGSLYPVIQRALGGGRAGKAVATVGVASLFFFIHVNIYSDSQGKADVGKLLSIGLGAVSFTIMRAYSRRLLPSYTMHLLYNLFNTLAFTVSLIPGHGAQG